MAFYSDLVTYAWFTTLSYREHTVNFGKYLSTNNVLSHFRFELPSKINFTTQLDLLIEYCPISLYGQGAWYYES